VSRLAISLVIITVVVLSLSVNLPPAAAIEMVTVLDQRVEYAFGEQVTFWARFQTAAPIESVEILYRPRNAATTFTAQMLVESDAAAYTLDMIQNPQLIPVFSIVEYRYRVTLQDGQVVYSENFSFQYIDNRFTWQSLEEQPFQVNWVNGDLALGQSVLDAARNGLKHAREILNLPDVEGIDIYVYPGSADLQSALQLGGFDLAAGHASPEFGVMMISMPAGPAQLQEIQRQVPHELMHLLLFDKLGERYTNVPTWLNEGLSSLNETYPNPEYYVLLQDAVENNTILPMESLCGGFRLEVSLFYLSYAQSDAFTRYLYDNFGSSKLEEMLNWYADGVGCTRAPELAYGQSFTRLENNWLSGLKGDNQGFTWLEPLLPWLVLLVAAIFVPLLLAVKPGKRGQSSSSPKSATRGG
jgi:hypothetical protein